MTVLDEMTIATNIEKLIKNENIFGGERMVKYLSSSNEELDNIAYENVSKWLKNTAKLTGNYFESEIYDYDGLSVSLWLDVFNKSSIQSFNYFTNGDISSHNLLIPAYEDKEGCF